ncbi:MAG: hypothetical protein RRC07_06900 [Anaerolineae bacterium]|nr:hypothetical protein [Anaerolineae bacterium]
MSISAIVHIVNEEPILCELEELPRPEAQSILMLNPRRRDGKDLRFLEEDVATVIVPWHRVTFIQVLPSTEVEEVIGFVREER